MNYDILYLTDKAEIRKNISEITSFYNLYFPDSKHREEYKLKKYNDKTRRPIIFIVKDIDGAIKGLLESWDKKNDSSKKYLVTILIDESLRGKGIARLVFNKAFDLIIESNNMINHIEELIVHFRDRNKHLIDFYERLGFSNPSIISSYSNGDPKWEMKIKL
jgi:ribosomal protein S18 acetylase RimI-like enzyme